MDRILFSTPYFAGLESSYLTQALMTDHWQGDGPFTRRATTLLRSLTGVPSVLLTTSCTHALEMASLLIGLGPGDEVICPTFTFSSGPAAIVIRGAVPVFVDSEPVTLNMDVSKVEAAITERTKAISVVHYGGVAADVSALLDICRAHGLALIEDTAHGLGATYRGQHLGTFGDLATLSFHDTKNVAMGEGGALLINDVDAYAGRAEILREKGTNRARFWRGEVDKYTWVDQGSSYLPSDLLAAVLTAQLEAFGEIQNRRHHVWDRYQTGLAGWGEAQGVSLMQVPEHCGHPAHLFYLMMPTHADQAGLIGHLRERGVVATFHYQPLDASPAGRRFGRTPQPCVVAHDLADRLVRLPLYAGLTETDIDRVLDGVASYRTDRQVPASVIAR